jgi:hypothetical protein
MIQARAERIAASPLLVGFPIAVILPILLTLLPIFAKLCDGDKEPEKLREKAARQLAKGKTKPGPKQRREMRKQGYSIAQNQDNLWTAIVIDTANAKPGEHEKIAGRIKWAAIGVELA